MNEYTILITATSEKRVTIKAHNKDEALALGMAIYDCSDLLHFTDDDISELTGVVEAELDNSNDNNECCEICEECEHCCDECGSCLLLDESETDEEKCFNCPYYCQECGACHFDGND